MVALGLIKTHRVKRSYKIYRQITRLKELYLLLYMLLIVLHVNKNNLFLQDRVVF